MHRGFLPRNRGEWGPWPTRAPSHLVPRGGSRVLLKLELGEGCSLELRVPLQLPDVQKRPYEKCVKKCSSGNSLNTYYF